MSRRGAREVALKTLFAMEFSPEAEIDATLKAAKDNLKEVEETPFPVKPEILGSRDIAYSKELVQGVKEHEKSIDEEIDGAAKEWSLERMSSLDKILLRVAVYEMFYAVDRTPHSVAINEVVELSKAYGGDETPGFINGILGALVKKHG